MGTDNGDPEDSWPLEMHDLEMDLRRRADREIRDALRITVALMAGYKRSEIERLLALTHDEYKRAHSWLRGAIRQTARGDGDHG